MQQNNIIISRSKPIKPIKSITVRVFSWPSQILVKIKFHEFVIIFMIRRLTSWMSF